ncbi:MAG TPA: DegT/DnrJ/EryC1/StrS family aminotransferase [Nocardioides sp.]|uniref:DegT/DnrJ/EryC1/StrS family aminotransferase n=1 Tax=Nocardioides sp. TaxID=35761 RepID=UPI002F402EF5
MTENSRIPVAGPSITELEAKRVLDAVTHAWYDDANRPIDDFETAFARYIGRAHAGCLPSCTAGLHLALAALGIGPGDEVIVPDLTWIATSAPISYVGAQPVFADVDPTSLCLTIDTVAACVTPRTKAVIAVDLYGAMPDMEALAAFADESGITLIEDAAEALGSEIAGRRAGSFGRVSVFSFHGSKTLTTGEGGMLLTDDPDLFRRVNVLRDHGRRPGDRAFNNFEVAFKYKMSGLQAALGAAQLERVDELLEGKRRIHRWYKDGLAERDDVSIYSSDNAGVVWWMTSAHVSPETGWDKDRLQAELSRANIDSRPIFRPLSSLPAYRETSEAARARDRNQVAYRVSPWGINLPSALALTQADVQRVCDEMIYLIDRRIR